MSTPSKEPLTFDEKISKLKKLHSVWDPDAKKMIEGWQEAVGNLKFKKGWLELKPTIALRDLAAQQISAISSRLAGEPDLDEIERKLLFKLKDAHTVYLAVLTDDPADQIQQIEGMVDENLETPPA